MTETSSDARSQREKNKNKWLNISNTAKTGLFQNKVNIIASITI